MRLQRKVANKLFGKINCAALRKEIQTYLSKPRSNKSTSALTVVMVFTVVAKGQASETRERCLVLPMSEPSKDRLGLRSLVREL